MNAIRDYLRNADNSILRDIGACPVCGTLGAVRFEKHGNDVVQCQNCEYEVYDGGDGTPALLLWNTGYIDEEARQEALAYIRARDS